MKTLTQEEADKIAVKPSGRGTYLRSVLFNMKVNDIILLEPKDWKWKRKQPTDYLRRLEKNNGLKFSCGKALDGSGWVIKRLG